MIIQLQPEQLSMFWDAIKHAVFSIYRVPEEQKKKAANKALAELMTGNYQCWVMYEGEGEERKTYAIVITSVVKHGLFDFNILRVDALYGFRKLEDEMIQNGYEKIREFGERNECEKVVCESSVKRIDEIVKMLGMREVSRCYELDL